MKKWLRIVGIVLLIAGVLSLSFAALNRFGYYHVLDGSAELYHRLHQRTPVFSATGFVLTATGTACLFVRSKKQRGNSAAGPDD